jgi:hypothetical protein
MNNPEFKLGPDVASDLLELRAAEQRRRLHESVQELRATVKERLDVKKNLREHFGPAAGAAGVIGVLMGYGAGFIFRR